MFVLLVNVICLFFGFYLCFHIRKIIVNFMCKDKNLIMSMAQQWLTYHQRHLRHWQLGISSVRQGRVSNNDWCVCLLRRKLDTACLRYLLHARINVTTCQTFKSRSQFSWFCFDSYDPHMVWSSMIIKQSDTLLY